MNKTLETTEVRKLLRRKVRICVLTGAGVSAESGIPTFRGAGGLWRKFRPQELATPEAFARDPRLVWEWYDWRRGLIAAARPNPGHEALVRLERRCPNFLLATQNVDGLHLLAGSKRVVSIHGDIWELHCTACGRSREDRAVPLPELPPTCPDCGGLLRPGVVWFGESLPPGAFAAAAAAARGAEAFLVVGTAGAVEPAASLTRLAREAGAFVVEVNLESSALSSLADVSFRGKAGEILPALVP
ncbi:MAG: NAD-dependent protein deacylase [Elusimicrobia bacterium GWA2_69_24]|nr:MAG: NAD-dependent protein deacylase [Elusimicrobia bacterium GWA2_69_24]HBL16271.1 NAD-dependent protein deacylase [Elusimicrobiota bacterium]